ncbi:serpin family protein [soil metagenome]
MNTPASTAQKPNVTVGFGLSLLKKEVAASKGKNVLVSPASVAIALAMTLNGAKEATLAAMKATLGYSADESVEAINASLAAIIAGVTDPNIGVVLKVANAIWADQSVDFKADFFDRAADSYNAQVNTADFLNPQTIADINGWADLNTNGKIPTIIDEISPDMVMYLLNAVYFKGSWTTKFDKSLTTTGSFAGEAGAESADMMFRNGDMRYSQGENYAAVALPFGDNKRVQLYVLLPNEGVDINTFVEGLDAAALDAIKSTTWESEVDLTLPRFELDYDVDLKDTLCDLGLEPACLPGADFTGMADEALLISTVKHKTYAKFDEDGGEAAAVTAVGMSLECMVYTRKLCVDRPFVAILMDEGTDTLLFAGKIASTKK